MHYQRVHVLGGPGSGKTYVAARIAAALGIQAYDLNLIHWNHTYEKNQLVPARALLSRLHKTPVECKTLAHVFVILADSLPGDSETAF